MAPYPRLCLGVLRDFSLHLFFSFTSKWFVCYKLISPEENLESSY